MKAESPKNKLTEIPSEHLSELQRIVNIIRSHVNVDLIILFGKYAGGSMQSVLGGYELLLMTHQENSLNQPDLSDFLDKTFCRSERKEPNIFLHRCSLSFFNSCYPCSYFFSSVINEGIPLYDNGKCAIPAKIFIDTNGYQSICKSYKHFSKWAFSFMNKVECAWEQQQNRLAALNLHYAADMLFKAFEVVFYGTIIRCSHLEFSYYRTRHFSQQLAESFDPEQSDIRIWYGQLLYYLKYSRHLPNFKLYEKDYRNCLMKLKLLQEIVTNACAEQINIIEKCLEANADTS